MISLSWKLFYSISVVIVFNNAVCRGRDIFISVNGSDNEFCLQEIPDIIYCRTLDYAFSGTIGESDIAYHIGEGEFELPKGYSFTNVANVGFHGSSAAPTKLVCKEELCSSAGLAFVDTRNVVLENLEIVGCGMKRNSSSSIDGGKTRLPLKTALYFQHCSDVSLLKVSLDESTGIGATMYDTQGRVEIKSCSFIGSTSTLGSTSRGGLYVETTYCNDPSTCRSPIKHAHYRVSSSVFKNNAASVDDIAKNITYILPNKGRHVSFGRGGGLGVFLRDEAHNNTFVIEHCKFFNNSALWGGGAYFSFQDDASQNSIEVKDSVFRDNQADVKPPTSPTIKEENKGSSLRVNFFTFNSKQQHGNRVIVDGCVFDERSQVMSVLEVATDSFVQTNASLAGFENVFQLVNSRIDTPLFKCSALSIVSVSGESSQLVNKLSNVTIKTTDRYLSTFADHDEGFRSLLYFQNIVVFFEANIDLDSSKKCQGILAVDTHIVVLPHSTVIISNNQAISGGGMALYNSFIELHPNTALNFSNNTALQKGGAIFSTFTPTRSPYIRLCFLHYHDIAAKPEEWVNVSVSFINNVAMWKGNVLFATSLRNCFWGKAYGPSRESTESKLKVFTNPRVFRYTPRRNLSRNSNDMATGAASISYYPPSHVNKIPKITFIPGKLEDLSDKFRVSNDFNRSSRFSPFSVQLYQHNQKQLKLKEENRFTDTFEVELRGCPFNNSSGDNRKPILVLQSLEDYTVTYEVEIDMSCCPPGFLYREEEMTCGCSTSGSFIRTCQTRNFTATLSRGYWAGYLSDNNSSCRQLWGGKCPSGFCSYDPPTPLPLTDSVDDLDNLMCGGNNRKGILCGQCKTGYCNPINVCSAPCINSTSAGYDWWQWIPSETTPLTVFIVLIFVFDFNLLSGPLNSYLLYAQFIAVIYANDHWVPFEKQFLGESDVHVYNNRSLSNFMISLYGVFTVSLFNMDFFSTLLPPFCFTTDLNALHLIGIKFAFKLYPLVIIIIVLLGFQIHKKCHNYFRCFSCCSCCQTLFRWFSWKSIVHALAAIFVLNYAGFLKWATAIFSPAEIVSFHNHSLQKYRVYHHGDWEFSNRSYLGVAIPVLLTVIIINLPMSLFLAMCYPVIPTLVEQVKDSRNRCLRWLRNTYFVKVFQRDWVHHTAELFQQPYRDGLYKCFAGFLLLFRIPLIVVIMIPNDYKYLICGVLLIAWIVVHCLCWPNTKKWVNIVDMLIYADMAIISFMHSYRNTAVALVNDGDGDDRPNQQESFDKGLLFLELLPTFYLVGYVLHFPMKLLWQRCIRRFLECRQIPDRQPPGEVEYDEFRPEILISSNSSEPKARADGYQEL